jgi:methylphosphotriester-DNA--protein-cysteine methyltransferase
VIILSGVLVVLAIALLVTGIVTGNTGHEVAGLDGLKLIYISIGVSIISALCLAIGVFLRRKELFGSAESGPSAKRSATSRSGKTARPAKAKARVGAADGTPAVPVTSATAVDVPAETTVFVVPGRKRYHLETCRQLAGRDKEELTFVEAREEGFTACTACMPDTALAARASLSEIEPAEKPADDDRSTESLESAADTADLRHVGDDPSQVTRLDLPVTRLEPDTAEHDAEIEHEAEIEPAAESRAAAELRDVPETSASTETDEPAADTARQDEATETLEAAPQPATERPSARSRSFFEPLERSAADDTADSTTADTSDEDTSDEDTSDEDAVTSPEPSEPEDTPSAALHDAEPAAEEPAAEESAEQPDNLKPSESEPPAESAADDTTETDEAAEADHNAPEPAKAEADTDGEAADAGDDTAEHADLPFVRILSGTKRYHRPDCALIEDIAEDADDLETLSPAEAKERGCTPCLVCQPDKDLSDDTY